MAYRLTSVENQRKCILPMNDISSTIFYNQRIVLSAPIKHPVVWHCSKVEQTSPKGISHLTFVQEEWDEHTDVFEYNDGTISNTYYSEKIVSGMWASYNGGIVPTEYEEPKIIQSITSTITYSGVKPEIKIGGSYKKFTVTFKDADGEELPYENGVWSFTIEGMDVSDKVALLDNTTSTELNENQIKVKFLKDDSYIGKILTITFTSDDTVSEIEMALVAL